LHRSSACWRYGACAVLGYRGVLKESLSETVVQCGVGSVNSTQLCTWLLESACRCIGTSIFCACQRGSVVHEQTSCRWSCWFQACLA
jgi:hypothetical protein